MKEIRTRLLTAWHALLGHAILSGIQISRGEVFLPDRHGYLSHDASIKHCQVWTRHPVRFTGKGEFSNNEGTGIAR